MTYQYYIDANVGYMFVTHFDTYLVEEELHQIEVMCSDDQFQIGFNILRDVRSTNLPESYNFQFFMTESKPKFVEIQHRIGESNFAWVLGNGRDYGLVHQWIVSHRLSNAIVTRKPFRDIGAAMQWLGLPEDYQITFPALKE